MTLEEFKEKKSYWKTEVNYWSWASVQPASEEQRASDIANYEKAWSKYKELCEIEDRILEKGLKNVLFIS